MRNRSFSFTALEVVVPLALAVALGLGLFLVFTPGLGFGKSADPQVVRIYSSVPQPSYDSMVHGIQMAIDESNGRAGDFRIEYVPLNDAVAQADGSVKWDAGVELANARRAAEDPDAMAYIGTYNSGAAKISIPVLNRVHMAMISPGNTYPGLTKPGTGTAGEPWTYFPLGVRNYFRVVPADDLQGSAAAAYAKQIGAKSVYVLDDTELYGHGIAVIFTQTAKDLGLEVKGGPEGIDVRAQSYGQLAQKILATNPDLVYFGGTAGNHPGQVLRDLRQAGYSKAFMGADGIVDKTFVEQSGELQSSSASNNVYSTLVGLPASKLAGPGADWYSRYKSRWGNDNNEDFAPFGYEAGRVAIHGIGKAGKKDREAVRAAVAATSSADLPDPHILGDWRFDANGDTSLVNISVQSLTSNASNPWGYLGLMVFNPQTKTWTLQKEQQ